MLLVMKDNHDDPMFDPDFSRKKCHSKDTTANSVKRVIMLSVVQKIQENYYNLEQLWKATKLGDLKTCVSCDHKVSNIISGIQVSTNVKHWSSKGSN